MPIQNNFPSIGFELLPNIPSRCLLVEWALVKGPNSGIWNGFLVFTLCVEEPSQCFGIELTPGREGRVPTYPVLDIVLALPVAADIDGLSRQPAQPAAASVI